MAFLMSKCTLEANAFTFSSAIKACERQGCWEAVGQLLLHMAEDGIQANGYIFNAAVETFGKAQMWPVALCLARDMTTHQIQSDIITGSTLLGAFEPRANNKRMCCLAECFINLCEIDFDM